MYACMYNWYTVYSYILYIYIRSNYMILYDIICNYVLCVCEDVILYTACLTCPLHIYSVWVYFINIFVWPIHIYLCCSQQNPSLLNGCFSINLFDQGTHKAVDQITISVVGTAICQGPSWQMKTTRRTSRTWLQHAVFGPENHQPRVPMQTSVRFLAAQFGGPHRNLRSPRKTTRGKWGAEA